MADDLDLLFASFNQYVVSPLNAFGLGGFLFDVEGEEINTLTSEITDHYLEDNTTIQDHIAVRPTKITLKGYVGELVYNNSDGGVGGALATLTQKLTTLDQYLPQLSAAATQLKGSIDAGNLGNLGNISVSDAANYWALVQNLAPSSTKQMQAYSYFKALWQQKILVGVQTPFEFLTNMAIESIVAVQPENSKFIADFSITLKQIRTVSELSVTGPTPYGPPTPNLLTGQDSTVSSIPQSAANSYVTNPGPVITPQGRTALQSQSLQTLGNMPGLSESPSTIDSALAAIGIKSLPAVNLQ